MSAFQEDNSVFLGGIDLKKTTVKVIYSASACELLSSIFDCPLCIGTFVVASFCARYLNDDPSQ